MMDDNRLHVAVIIASTRHNRFGPTVADWLVTQARRHGGQDVDVIDLAAEQLPDVLDVDNPAPPNVVALGERIEAADAFVIVTPEYNHSFPAPLKTTIDWYVEPWQAKPIAFVSYGGQGGGLRAVEQLRLVFAELGATTVRETVSFHNYWNYFDAAGNWPALSTEADAAAKRMLDQLGWWASALRNHRQREHYPADS